MSKTTMNRHEFKRALKELGLGTASKSTMRALGIKTSQIQRLAHGTQKASRQLHNLIFMYQTHGIPKRFPWEE